ncbi:MAG: phosphate/phosphite/phosphonate ABC transporter substrate-binding protein [Clostridiales bacterium]|nr:phosphate/phosphite/phosphonate ABC transporter substrate-binding protein [Clostridiales bacterium]
MKKVMKVVLSALMVLGLTVTGLGCGSSSGGSKSANKSKLTIVWYPNESGGEYKDARQEIADIVHEATGLEVENKTTTDYSVAIESLANGTADIGYLGAQGYIECHDKNKKVQPMFVESGASGTLDDALYYSWMAVNKDDASEYKDGDSYGIDNIQGKKMSFVSTSSTSGFKVPTAAIVSHFKDDSKWSKLTQDDLTEGGNDKFFSEVLYGDSHQGSAVNLLSGKADVAAFCDTELKTYCEPSDGDWNKIGTTYKILDNAAQPFDKYAGKEFTAIAVSAVLNSPFVVNTDNVDSKLIDKIVNKFLSDDVTNNEKVFIPDGSDGTGFFTKTDKECFLKVKDSWFDTIRELSK